MKKSYDSDSDDILGEFLIPLLSEAVSYKRLAGFFSSGMLAVAARGISRFIQHRGKMEIICGAQLSQEDVEAIRKGYAEQSNVLETRLVAQITNIEDEFTRDHVSALGWMIANGYLSIKIALVIAEDGYPVDSVASSSVGIFHQKVGVFEDDEGNQVSFSGSDNESASAWLRHIEEFKVFRSWIEGEREYVDADESKFLKFWEGRGKRTLVLSAPEALNQRLIQFAPKEFSELDLTRWHPRWKGNEKGVGLWRHQSEAVDAWFNNNCVGILEMATGSGKTNVALECLRRLSRQEKRLLTVITTPYDHLTKQWIRNATEYGIVDEAIIADSSNPKWKDKLADSLLDLRNEVTERLIVFTTHATLGSEDFVRLISSSGVPSLLIADEVHGIGAPQRQKGLLSVYRYRLGLSATPRRWFDEEGTETLFEYFGSVVYEFSLRKGIHEVNETTGRTFLVPYQYLPRFVYLTEDEHERYRAITGKIIKKYHTEKNRAKKEEALELLYFERARILDDASAKFGELRKILEEIGEINACLVYCSPKQLTIVQDILNEMCIVQTKFTMDEGVSPSAKYGQKSERECILDRFSDGKYQALVAMKCLDEGVDVPPAKMAIIMASSSNPREFIQRRGRILRRARNKDQATIYDIIVLPPAPGRGFETDEYDIDKKILRSEMDRFKEFADDADNSVDCLRVINEVRQRYVGKH